MAGQEVFHALGESELQVEHAGVRKDHDKAGQFAVDISHRDGTDVCPIDLSEFPRKGFEAKEGLGSGGSKSADILFNVAVASQIAQRDDLPKDLIGREFWVFCETGLDVSTMGDQFSAFCVFAGQIDGRSVGRRQGATDSPAMDAQSDSDGALGEFLHFKETADGGPEIGVHGDILRGRGRQNDRALFCGGLFPEKEFHNPLQSTEDRVLFCGGFGVNGRDTPKLVDGDLTDRVLFCGAKGPFSRQPPTLVVPLGVVGVSRSIVAPIIRVCFRPCPDFVAPTLAITGVADSPTLISQRLPLLLARGPRAGFLRSDGAGMGAEPQMTNNTSMGFPYGGSLLPEGYPQFPKKKGA